MPICGELHKLFAPNWILFVGWLLQQLPHHTIEQCDFCRKSGSLAGRITQTPFPEE
jgi:hypothetical protein